jgi:hypothetical protein
MNAPTFSDIFAKLIEIRHDLRSVRTLVAQHPQKPLHGLKILLYHLDASLGHLAGAVRSASVGMDLEDEVEDDTVS